MTDSQSSNGNSASNRSALIDLLINVVATLIISVITYFVVQSLGLDERYALIGIFLLVLILIALLWRRQLGRLLHWILHGGYSATSLTILLLCLVILLLVLHNLTRVNSATALLLDATALSIPLNDCGVYNYDGNTESPGQIEAKGQNGLYEDKCVRPTNAVLGQSYVGFSYQVNPESANVVKGESSGAWIRFEGVELATQAYNPELSFFLRYEGDIVDLHVFLVADEDEKEVLKLKSPLLSTMGVELDGSWQLVSIDLTKFETMPDSNINSEAMERGIINKIVFRIDNQTANSSVAAQSETEIGIRPLVGTVFVRDISFSRR